jgi:hypothetical protein
MNILILKNFEKIKSPTVASSLLPQGGTSYLKSFRPAVVATKLR